MNNIQNCDSYINVSSSKTYRVMLCLLVSLRARVCMCVSVCPSIFGYTYYTAPYHIWLHASAVKDTHPGYFGYVPVKLVLIACVFIIFASVSSECLIQLKRGSVCNCNIITNCVSSRWLILSSYDKYLVAWFCLYGVFHCNNSRC
jgi:hypothetical protein